MTGLTNVQIPRSSQGLKGEISLIFSEPDREIGESIHESLMRSGFEVTENPADVAAGIPPAGTALYLTSAGTPAGIATVGTPVEPTRVRRQLTLWRALFAAAAIGLVAFMGVSGVLYQQNQSANRDLITAIEQRDTAMTERQQMNDRLYEANITTDRALAARDNAVAERKQMNDRLYEANATADRALAARDNAIAERKQMNDELYTANVMTDKALAARDRAIAERLQMNDKLYAANARADEAIRGEQAANERIEDLQKELNQSNQRNDLLEELLRTRPIQTRPTNP